jgi:hypothetical protein
MTADASAARPRRSRTLVVLVIALAVVAVLAAVAIRQRTLPLAAAQEDCDEKPPPNAFAVAECDEGTASPEAAGAPGAASPTPAVPPR